MLTRYSYTYRSFAIIIEICKTTFYIRLSLITVARDRDSDSEILLYFGRVVYFFSVHQIFAVPGPIFTKLYHTTRYVLK